MYRNQTAVRLRDTLSRPQSSVGRLGDDGRREQLRQQVFDAVDDMKRMGWPPERVIIAIKQIARDVGLAPSLHFVNAGESLSNGDALLASIVRWAIDRYFKPGTTP